MKSKIAAALALAMALGTTAPAFGGSLGAVVTPVVTPPPPPPGAARLNPWIPVGVGLIVLCAIACNSSSGT